MPSISLLQHCSRMNVPSEIWSEIFELAVPCKKPFPSIRTEAPVSLTQTCSLWRKIAVDSTPRLWTTINVTINDAERNAKFEFYPRLELIDLWLERSHNLPLSISLYGPDAYGWQHDGTWPEPCEWDRVELSPPIRMLFARLFLEMPRWKIADLSVGGIDGEMLSTYEITAGGAPMLQSLRVATYLDLDVKDWKSVPYQLWKNSPFLRQLVFAPQALDKRFTAHRRKYWLGWATSIYLPFQQLTELRLDSDEVEAVAVAEVIAILQSSPNLTCFRALQVKNSHFVADTTSPLPNYGTWKRYVWMSFWTTSIASMATL
ncbi:hypothetical protein GALMADRAFT_147033 [Galerina marginata CBS 339.88]|uniref:Uncharacterized protein n=1 Tax=Galerina marginata (strain CBS 339.88) TaxID=685588 RepID=A0A067SL67_GALM3|nr:hypothetical protein GALMADRAFT_147033 [Galerina marginata CBS 339.88]